MLNMDTGGGRVILAAACGNKTSDGVVASNQFPAGLRVLVVDDDPTCLKILERMLRNCLYEVATCTRAIEALSLLRERKFVFDLVLSDVHMPDMDGFKLLEHIGLEMDLPVIMMSVDDKKEVVMKGVTHGACDYLIKPIRMEAIKNIWQHVVRKRKNELKELEQSGSVDDIDRNKKTDESDYASSANEGSWKSSKRRKEEEDEVEERDDTSNLKKPRVVWSVELHQQFVGAVNQLGIDKAVPKKILELMNVPGLTRENVASHLQKYRLYLRRLSGVSQHPSGLNMPFMGSQDANYGPLSSLEGFDLQSLVVPTQIPPHSLATLQAGGLTSRPTTNTGISMTDHRNPFSNETSTLKFAVGQELNGGTTQVNIFHGRPTNVEPKQLPHLHQSIQLPGSGLQIPDTAPGFLNLPTTRMSQSRSRGQLSTGISGDLPSGLPISVGQQMMSNEMASQVLGRNVNVLSGRGAAYNSGLQSLFDVQANNTPELPGNSFPLGVAAGLSSLQSTGMFQDRRNSEVKRPRSIPACYDTFNEFQQGKPESWELQNDNSTFDPLRHAKTMRGNHDFSQAISSSQGFSSAQKSGKNQITSMASNAMASLGENQFGTPANFQQHYNYLPVESLFRIKTESNADFNSENMFQKHLDQEDLMSSFLKQQEAVGLVVESGPNFDGYQIDNIQA